MKKWDDVKHDLTSISPEEMNVLELTAQLVSDIVKRRKELGWTQQELADRAGVKQSAVARLENTGNIPRVDTLLKLAMALGLTLTFIPDEEAAALAQVAVSMEH